jgi:protoporphyrinogen oxidase
MGAGDLVNERRAAVVGGGLLGATLALRLAEAGREVTLYEASSDLGGLAGAWNLGDIVWDRHYHVTLLSDSHLRGLLVDLGLDDEIEWVDTRTGCFAEGELLSVSNTIEFLRFPLLRFADRLRLGWTVWYASRIRDWERLEGIGVEEWLTRVSGGRAFDSFWRPLLRSKLGDDYRRASAAFIWAVIQRLYAARRSGLKRERFGYVPGGYARVLERLRGSLEDVGVEVRLGSRVEAVAAEPAPNVRDASGTEGFDRVVVTVPAPAASRLVTDLPPEDRDRLAGIDYQGVVCASLLLDRPLSPFYVTNITDAGFPFTGVIEMTALVDPAVFGDRHLVYVPRYLDGGDPFFDRPEGEIRRDFVAGLTRMHPGFSESNVLAFRLSRVRHVMPVPTLGYSKRLPRQDLLPGVTIVNSSHIVNGTLNVNETVGLAEDTARRLLGPSHERPGEEPS